jgi:hypothetical protein
MSNKPKGYYKISISSLGKKQKPGATAEEKTKPVVADATTDTKSAGTPPVTKKTTTKEKPKAAVKETPRIKTQRWMLSEKELNSPRLKALEKKYWATSDILKRVEIRAQIDEEIDSIFDARHTAESELPKPKEENIVVKDDRHTYYDIKGQYKLMFWKGKTWIKSNDSSVWKWVIGLKSPTFQPDHLTIAEFSKLLKSKPTFKQLQSDYRIYRPHKIEFDSRGYEYQMMNVGFNTDDLKAKIVYVK